ncbi:hypothetical protein ACWEF6_01685 [Amycolatopsis sp. NPDC004772]
MNTHPIDPSIPRGGFLVIVKKSAGTVARYARDREEAEQIAEDIRSRPGVRDIFLKELVPDVQPDA